MENSNDLLQDVNDLITYEDASVGQRFLNLLIDAISFYVVIILVGILGGLIWGEAFIDAMANINPYLDRLLSLILFGVYLIIVEGLFKGRTLGKLVTGTKAVRWNNEPTDWRDSLLRGLSRMVPFEQLSGFGGHPWHDQWTDTKVVKVR